MLLNKNLFLIQAIMAIFWFCFLVNLCLYFGLYTKLFGELKNPWNYSL